MASSKLLAQALERLRRGRRRRRADQHPLGLLRLHNNVVEELGGRGQTGADERRLLGLDRVEAEERHARCDGDRQNHKNQKN